MRRANKIYFHLTAGCLGLIAGALIAEGALRLAVHYNVPPSLKTFITFMHQTEEGNLDNDPLFRTSSDPALGHEFAPNIRNKIIRINSDGFRGPDYSKEVPDHKVRLAVVGDSETFGQQLKEDKTLSGVLQQRLNMDGAQRYEVLNFGVPAYNTSQELRLLETKVLKYHPSIVILYYVFNDPLLMPTAVIVNRTPLHRFYMVCFLDWFFSKRITEDIFRNRFALAQASTDPTVMFDFYLRLHDSPFFEATKDMIRRMATLSRKQQCRFVLVIAPEIFDIDDFKNYPYASIHRKLKALSSPEIEVIDPLPALMALGKRPGDFWVSDNDPHKNEEANSVIAEAVLSALKLEPALQRPQ